MKFELKNHFRLFCDNFIRILYIMVEDTQTVINTVNDYIREGNLFLLQEYYESLKIPSEAEIEVYGEETAPPIKRLNLAYIFTKTFTNACLYNRYHIVVWMMEIYEELDGFAKVEIRPTFNYVRHMTKMNRFYKIHNYLVKHTKNNHPKNNHSNKKIAIKAK